MKDNKRVNTLFLKIRNDFKFQLLMCVLLCFVIIAGFFVINRVVDYKNSREYIIVEDIRLVNSFENISTVGDNIFFSGYAFNLEKNSINSVISVFLRNVETEREVWLETEQIDRADVNLYFDSEYDYSNTGFKASADISKIDRDQIYEVFISIDYFETNDLVKKRRTVSSQRYVQNNILYSYNPNEFDVPNFDVESVLLKEVFRNGTLCLYQKEAGMYIYQYKDKMYWIAASDFEFSKEGLTYIVYSFNTSQINKLPKNRIQHKFDRQSFYFEDNEYKEENTAPYRVAIRDIPNDYPITYMTTGLYDEQNEIRVWEKKLHLDNLVHQ